MITELLAGFAAGFGFASLIWYYIILKIERQRTADMGKIAAKIALDAVDEVLGHHEKPDEDKS